MSDTSMPKAGKLLIAGATLALAMTAFAGSATLAANESRITFVNGIPGTPIDICLKGQQVKYGLKSGHVTSKIRNNGSHKLKVFKKKAGGCNGVKLAEKTIPLNYQDLTVVITKKSPKVVVFDNTGAVVPPGASYLAVRDAADLGPVSFEYAVPVVLGPSLDPVWAKGDQLVAPYTIGVQFGVFVTRPGQVKDLATPKFQVLMDQKRHEWILIGTKGKNAKIVPFSRSFWPVP